MEALWVKIPHLVGILLVVAATALDATAQAEDESAAPPPEALEFFETGRQHYNAGRYTRGGRQPRTSPGARSRIHPHWSSTSLASMSSWVPAHIETAIRYAERYLQMLPEDAGEERAKIQTTLLRLNGAKAYFERQREAEAGASPELMGIDETVYVQSRGVADGWFWGLVLGGGALIAASVATGIVALNRRATFEARTLTPLDTQGRLGQLRRHHGFASQTNGRFLDHWRHCRRHRHCHLLSAHPNLRARRRRRSAGSR